MKTLHDFIQELAHSFQLKTRDNGESFYCQADNAEEYVSDLMHTVHDGIMPDDYKYQFAVEALEGLHEHVSGDTENLDDVDYCYITQPDVLNYDLLTWVRSNLTRMSYCDDVLEEYQLTLFSDLLSSAQERERSEVLNIVIEWIEQQQGELWDTEDMLEASTEA